MMSKKERLKKVSRKYNGLVAKIIETKEFHTHTLLETVVESMDRLIEKAEKKLAE